MPLNADAEVRFPHSPGGDGPGVLLTGLPLDRSYLVKVRHQQKRIASFRFRFDDDDGGRLCLLLNDLYLIFDVAALAGVVASRMSMQCAPATSWNGH